MSKLTREQKIEIYNKSINGYSSKSLSKEYNIRSSNIRYLIRLIQVHGFKILRNGKNCYYFPKLKKQIIHIFTERKGTYGKLRIQLKLKMSPVEYRTHHM